MVPERKPNSPSVSKQAATDTQVHTWKSNHHSSPPCLSTRRSSRHRYYRKPTGLHASHLAHLPRRRNRAIQHPAPLAYHPIRERPRSTSLLLFPSAGSHSTPHDAALLPRELRTQGRRQHRAMSTACARPSPGCVVYQRGTVYMRPLPLIAKSLFTPRWFGLADKRNHCSPLRGTHPGRLSHTPLERSGRSDHCSGEEVVVGR